MNTILVSLNAFSRKPFVYPVNFLESEFALCTLIAFAVSQLCFLKLIEVVLKTLDSCVDFLFMIVLLSVLHCSFFYVFVMDWDIKQISEFSFDGSKTETSIFTQNFSQKNDKMYLGKGSILHVFVFIIIIITVLYKFEDECYFWCFHFYVTAYSTVKIITRLFSVLGE